MNGTDVLNFGDNEHNYTVSLYHSLRDPSLTVSKHIATVLSCYHINIILTQSHVPSCPAALQPVFSHCVVTRNTKILGERVRLPPRS
jgi:hypothetical protein